MATNQLALVKKDVVDVVESKVKEFISNGELHLPENYSPHNAMKSAFLILQQAVDKDKRPVLSVCTKDSIANALLNTVVQGLNPGKQQCYYIAYGKTLVCQRSYFGTMAVAKQLVGATDIYAQVVYKGDEFEYEIKGANKHVIKHTQKLENVNPDNIIAAYCTVEREGHDHKTDIMTMAQIETAWSMSRMNPNKKDGTHQKHKEEMCKKTVINRTCKPLVNSSSDSGLMLKAFKESDEVVDEAAFEVEVAEEANQGEVIDITDDEPDQIEAPEAETTDENLQEEPVKQHGGPAF